MRHPDLIAPLDVIGLVRRVRRTCDVNQRELARPLGVSQSTVARWEAGESEPSLAQFQQLLDLVGCRLEAVGADGEFLRPMDNTTPRDQQGRLRPAHLDVIDTITAWGEPTLTAPQRFYRDLRRYRLPFTPSDHPSALDVARLRRARNEARDTRAWLMRVRIRARCDPDPIVPPTRLSLGVPPDAVKLTASRSEVLSHRPGE